jgi:hypothetical protein
MEPKDSLLCLQEPKNDLYPELDESSKIHLNIMLQSTSRCSYGCPTK